MLAALTRRTARVATRRTRATAVAAPATAARVKSSRVATARRARLASSAAPADGVVDPTALVVERTTQPKRKLPEDELQFGRTFSDHMLTVHWDMHRGWDAPRIEPYANLSLSPASSVLHYAIECFEGMKAYKDAAGAPRLFRPELNMQRMAASADRLCLPAFGEAQLLECIKELVRVDESWIPVTDGHSLYVRPTFIGTTDWLGVGPTTSALLFCILSPVGPYYPTGFKPVSLYAERSAIRAWPGGCGNRKVGGNYGPTIKPQVEAAARGYSQVLWLFGDNDQCTEVGTMNLFMFWRNEHGRDELVTPPLSDGTILPGITRRSILELARQWGEFDVVERSFTMPQVVAALKEGRVHEMFGAGTAVIVSPINKIGYDGTDYDVPLDRDDPSAPIGKLTSRVFHAITDIQYGRAEHEDWSVKL